LDTYYLLDFRQFLDEIIQELLTVHKYALLMPPKENQLSYSEMLMVNKDASQMRALYLGADPDSKGTHSVAHVDYFTDAHVAQLMHHSLRFFL